MRWQGFFLHFFCGVILVGLTSAGSQAGTIIHTTSGTGSGSLAGVSFTNQPFQVTITANTGDVQTPGFPDFAVNNVSTTIQLGSSVATTYAGSTYVNHASGYFYYSSVAVGDFFDTSNFYITNNAFKTYDLQSSLGPISVSPGSFWFFDTSLGSLTISNPTSVSFEARSVPEPSALLGACLGIGTAIALRASRNPKQLLAQI
jgi:hypothetical protein